MGRSLLALNTHSGSLADIPHVELLFSQNQTSRRDRAEADAPILAPYWMIVPRYRSITAPLSRQLERSSGGISIVQNPLIDGIIVFLLLLAGAFAGWTMRRRLPQHQLTDDTKSLVSVSMAVVATVSALVLGLLISNANTSFRALGGDVTTLSAQILRLDNILRRYGPDTYPARAPVRR